MTKQEEVDKILTKYTGKTGSHLDVVKQELAEVGVVIKVDRELPDFRTFFDSISNLSGEVKRQALLKYVRDVVLEEDGYVAVESILED